jgi:TolA-binding protein
MAGARRIAGIELGALTLLLGLGALLLLFAAAALGVLFGMRAQQRRDRKSRQNPVATENSHELTIAHWVEEGQRLFNVWQERVAHVTELQARLDAMAHEIDQLRAQVSRIDDLRAENLRLSQQGEVLLSEQGRLRSMLARIGELAQRASESRPGAAGETAPDLGP